MTHVKAQETHPILRDLAVFGVLCDQVIRVDMSDLRRAVQYPLGVFDILVQRDAVSRRNVVRFPDSLLT